MNIENEKTYDSVFWTGVVKMKRFFIPLVNEVFGEHYSANADIRLEPNKLTLEQADGSFSRREADALVTLKENGREKDYHIELETNTDKTFAVRIAEYAAGKAFKSVELTETGAKMRIPHSAVIFLKAENEVPDEFTIEIESPGGRLSYKAPVKKVRDYSISELFSKKLLLLLPFFGFNFEKRFEEMERSGVGELKKALDEINDGLIGMVARGEIDEAERSHLIDWTKRVLDKQTVNYKNVTKGVDEIMGGYILHTRTDDILNQGRVEGEVRGRSEEQRRRIEIMLRKDKTPQEIADFCDYPMNLILDVQSNIS